MLLQYWHGGRGIQEIKEAEVKLSLKEKAILDRIEWSARTHSENPERYASDYFKGGAWWMKDTREAFAKVICSNIGTVSRLMLRLESKGLIQSLRVRSKAWDQTKYYSVSSEKTQQLCISRKSTYPTIENRTIERSKIDLSSSPLSLSESLSKKSKTASCVIASEFSTFEGPMEEDSQQNWPSTNSETVKPKRNTKTAKAQSKPLKERLTTWDDTDEFAKVFANLHMLKTFKKTFDREAQREWQKRIMQELSVSASEMIALSNEWQEYHNEVWLTKAQLPKAMKSSFRTWINNYVARRNKNAAGPVKITKSSTDQEWAKYAEADRLGKRPWDI